MIGCKELFSSFPQLQARLRIDAQGRERQTSGLRPELDIEGAMTDTTHQFSMPAGLALAGDPIEANPFPIDDTRHRVWQEATLNAEEELSCLNSEYLETTPEDFARWTLDMCVGKFNIWAKRSIQVVWSDGAVRSYDQWLFNYTNAWLDSCKEAGYSDGLLLELRLRLIERLGWWKVEARRYLGEQKAHLARENAPSKSPNEQRGRRWHDSSQDIVRRRQIVLQNPNFTSKQMCVVFDGNRIPIPEGWSEEFHIETWVDAHKNQTARARIQRIISTDKMQN